SFVGAEFTQAYEQRQRGAAASCATQSTRNPASGCYRSSELPTFGADDRIGRDAVRGGVNRRWPTAAVRIGVPQLADGLRSYLVYIRYRGHGIMRQQALCRIVSTGRQESVWERRSTPVFE